MAIEAVETALDSEVYDVTTYTGFDLGQVSLVGGSYVGVYQGGRVDGSFATVEGAVKALARDRKHESGVIVNVTNV